MNSTTSRRAATGAVALAAGVALFLGGCAAGSGSDAPASSGTPAASGAQAGLLTITDPWVKAADEGMTAGFGVLENTGDADVVVVSASSPSATELQLHETVSDTSGQMVMREKKGGFVIPAGGSIELTPGGSHFMLMGLTGPVKAGDEVTFTVTLADGSTTRFVAPAKDYTGAQENYAGDGEG